MENKLSSTKEVVVRLEGLPELVELVSSYQHRIDILMQFVEDVFIAVSTPETVHYYFEDKYDCVDLADDALSGLAELLARHRACLEFFRANGIQPERVFGGIVHCEIGS